MIEIKNFNIKKAYEPEEGYGNLPQRELTANIGSKEDPTWVTIGKGWIKKDARGEQYVSVALETDRSYNKKDGTEVNVDGWTLVKTKDLQALLKGEKPIEIPEMNTIDLDTGEANSEDLPF